MALKNAENSRMNAACFETHLHDLDVLIKSVVCGNFPLTISYEDGSVVHEDFISAKSTNLHSKDRMAVGD